MKPKPVLSIFPPLNLICASLGEGVGKTYHWELGFWFYFLWELAFGFYFLWELGFYHSLGTGITGFIFSGNRDFSFIFTGNSDLMPIFTGIFMRTFFKDLYWEQGFRIYFHLEQGSDPLLPPPHSLDIHFPHQLVVSKKHVSLDMSLLIHIQLLWHIIKTFVFGITWSILRNADPRLQFWYVVVMVAQNRRAV